MDNSISFDDTFTFDDSIISAIDDIEIHVSKLKAALQNGEFQDTGSTREALDQCFLTCSREMLDEKIFTEILPVAYRQLLEELVNSELHKVPQSTNYHIHLLKGISETLGGNAADTLSRVKSKLSICVDLLDIWQKCLEQVMILQKVPARFVRSLPDNLPEALEAIFKHCKTSKNIYGDFLESLAVELKNLFQKASAILRQFVPTLKGIIVFDTDVESETALLAKVINHLGIIAITASGMDLRTFVEVTSAFAKLAITHEDRITDIAPDYVTIHLGQLIKDISQMLSIFYNSQGKVEEKMVKCCSMILKVIDKLCENYCAFLTNDILFSYVELLIRIYRCSPPCLKMLEVDEKLIDLVNLQISVGRESMLNTIFKCTDFMQAYFEYRAQPDVDIIGYHMLTLSIIKKLNILPYEHHSKWTFGSHCILDMLLSNVKCLYEELCGGELMLKGFHELGERPRLAGLYEATLLPICGLVSQVPASDFYSVEKFLLKHLLSGEIWESFLAADIWCFVARFGSSVLCYDHVKYLLKVYGILEKRRNSFEVIMLSNLIRRLYVSLPDEMKCSLVDEIHEFNIQNWIPISKCLPSKSKMILRERYKVDFNDISKALVELYEQPSVKNWHHLVNTIIILSTLYDTIDKETVDTLMKIWKSITEAIEYSEGQQHIFMSDLIPILLDITRLNNLPEESFFSVLNLITSSLLYMPSHIKPCVSYCLKENVNKFSDCSSELMNAVAKLNYQLLDDENPWVCQEAIDSFDFIVNTCVNEELVKKLLTFAAKTERLNSALSAYFSNMSFYKLEGFSSTAFHLRYVAQKSQDNDTWHTCHPQDDVEPKEKHQKFDEESIKMLEHRVYKICDELNDILKRKADLNGSALCKLRSVLEKL